MTQPAPYPADTRAKGWRFELDYEKIKQSDTWDLAAEIPMAQAALLMMWLVSWQQEPCGSLPNDEAVIRAKLRVPPAMWSKMRDVLMRGWWLADDGRLYHKTLSERVAEMMRKRRSDSDRQAERRKREALESQVDHAVITGVSRVTPVGVGSESSTDNRPLNTEEEPKTKTPRKRAAPAVLVSVDDMVAEGVDRQSATDWLVNRKAKGLPLTPTAWSDTKSEADKAGVPLPTAIKIAAGNGWAGFKAKWLTAPDGRSESAHAQPRPVTVPSADRQAEAFHAAMDERAATATRPPAAILSLAGRIGR